ncbi:ABC transporter permease subunit [Devosia algicola]|uniref:ABC transporter permease subunit n=1 Tax=Devosia algicola TaxID=3026418 RepID=A0ABY7YPR8_9HYPH|nr:ABC transporter permease subunit [Devosia algicola]WDR03244.1 ABC transporter permease subunit [Devosia algicola]
MSRTIKVSLVMLRSGAIENCLLGFESISPGQIDAARALGLRPVAVYMKILAPQAYAAAGPALFSNAIQMVKGSSLASLVAVDELTAASTTLISETYKAIEVLSFVGLLYGLIAMFILGLQWLYERRNGWFRYGR